MKSSTKKQPLRERPSLRARMKDFLERSPRLQTALYSDLLWGAVFTALIVLLLMPLQIFQIGSYKLNSIANETIVAHQNLRIPDHEATEKKKRERVAAVKSVYKFYDTKWRTHVNQIRRLFELGREHTLASLAPSPDSQAGRLQPHEDEEFLLRLKEIVGEQLGLDVPRDVLELLARNSFNNRLQNRTAGILEETLKRPIARTTLYTSLPAGYELRAQQDPANSKIAMLSLQEAWQQLRDRTAEGLKQLTVEERKQFADWLQTLVEPTAEPDVEETNKRLEEARSVETLYFGVKRGEVIVRSGDPITDSDTLAKINFILESRSKGVNYLLRVASLTLITAFLLYSLSRFASYYRRRKVRFHLFLLLCLTLAINLTVVRLVMMVADSFGFTLPLFQDIDLYYWAVPFAVGSVLIAQLVGTELAVIYSIVLVVLAAFLFGGDFTIILFALLGCFTVIYGLRQYRERTALIKSGIALGLMNVILILTLGMYNEQLDDPWAMIFGTSIGFFGGLLTAFVASFTLPVLESLFHITTDIKLLELSNHEHPLLRDLSLRAPGTFQHSILVGYLAESAASAVGANALFCRVSCLYHDIGKMLKPKYFVENTIDAGDRHKQLSPHMSALVIINHVKEGVELGRRHRLPESIVDIIPQHHGTKLISYFYEKARRRQKPELGPVNEEEFRYPGPKPQTRGAGIIMIADGVEASTRTLDDPNPSHLKGAIKAIIDDTFIDGQLDECDLTLKDLTTIAGAFLKVLQSMYHERIKYPGFELEKQTGKRTAKKDRPAESTEAVAANAEEKPAQQKLSGETGAKEKEERREA